MFFLHSQVLPPITYGKIAEDLLEKLVRMAPRVDFVCDSYISPSLKDIERIRRGNSEQIFSITGPEQTRPRDWQKSLKSPSFNRALIRFLAIEWKKDQYSSILEKSELFFGFEEKGIRFSASEGKVFAEDVKDLECTHEEADTRMIFHIAHISNSSIKNVVVQSNDTDIMVLLLHHVKNLSGIEGL